MKVLRAVSLLFVAAAAKKPTPNPDAHLKCSDWADAGQCDTNPGYMMHHCQESCMLSHNSPQCRDWARIGECKSNAKFMLHHCARECSKVIQGDKTNNHSKCQEWALKGECDANPVYMNHHCSLACSRVGSASEL